ncbi:MAG: SDR family NAD(P)-dependent oxidoreductase [Acidiferrobacterales bacterium]
MGRLDDKTAIVTGGTRGIGRAIAERFALEGAQVVVAARDEPDPPLGHTNIISHCADVSKGSDVTALVDFTIDRCGRLDILVNNAGVEIEKGIEDTSEEEWDWLMSINLKGVFLCCKSAIPPMRQQGGGAIINIGSYDGFQADPGLVAYCASKGGVHALSRAIAVDHGKDGIRCNVICPGWIKTEMMKAYLDSQSDAENAESLLIAQHPIGRVGQPTDIANLALWLASDESSFATGQLFVHDGGLTAHAPYVGG